MPYLTESDRQQVHKQGFAWDGAQLNYLITYHVNKFLTTRAVTRELRYADFAEALAALEGAKSEFERLVMAPYEDGKRLDNGYIYDLDTLLPRDQEPF